MMLSLIETSSFKKDLKRLEKEGNAPRYLVVDFPNSINTEDALASANRFMEIYDEAFKELAKWIFLLESRLGELKKIQCPVLVIGSKDDRVLGSKASLLIANQIPHSELFMYEGYGHAAYDTAPDYREWRSFLMKIKTIEAMLEAERIDPNLKSYTVDEAFAWKGLPRLQKSEAHSWFTGLVI